MITNAKITYPLYPGYQSRLEISCDAKSKYSQKLRKATEYEQSKESMFTSMPGNQEIKDQKQIMCSTCR